MLAHFARILPVLARAAMAREPALISNIERRVRLRELDQNGHMNQAAYAQVMELGRADWIVRSGALRRWRARGVNGVVASQSIVYRHELGPLRAYALDTRAVEMDGRLLRFETHLHVGERVHASNETRAIFVGPEGVLGASEARELCEGLMTSPLTIEDWRIRPNP